MWIHLVLRLLSGLLLAGAIRLGEEVQDDLDFDVGEAVHKGLHDKLDQMAAMGTSAEYIDRIRESIMQDKAQIVNSIKNAVTTQASSSSLMETMNQRIEEEARGHDTAEDSEAFKPVEEPDPEKDDRLHDHVWVMSPLEAQRWRIKNRFHRLQTLPEAKRHLQSHFHAQPMQNGNEDLASLIELEEKAQSKAERSFWRKHRIVAEHRETDRRARMNFTDDTSLVEGDPPESTETGTHTPIPWELPPATLSAYLCTTVAIPIYPPWVFANIGITGTLTYKTKTGCWGWSLDVFLGVSGEVKAWSGLHFGIGLHFNGGWDLQEVPFAATGMDSKKLQMAEGCEASANKYLKDPGNCKSGMDPTALIWSAIGSYLDKAKARIFETFKSVRQVLGKVVAWFRRIWAAVTYEEAREDYFKMQMRRLKQYEELFQGEMLRRDGDIGTVAVRVTCKRALLKPGHKFTPGVFQSSHHPVSRCSFIPATAKEVTTAYKQESMISSYTFISKITPNQTAGISATLHTSEEASLVKSHDVKPRKMYLWDPLDAAGVVLMDGKHTDLVVHVEGSSTTGLSVAGAGYLRGQEWAELQQKKVDVQMGLACESTTSKDANMFDEAVRAKCPVEVTLGVQAVQYQGTLSVKCKEADISNIAEARYCAIKVAGGVLVNGESWWQSTSTLPFDNQYYWGEGRSWSLWAKDGEKFPFESGRAPGVTVIVYKQVGATVETAFHSTQDGSKNRQDTPDMAEQFSWMELLGDQGFAGDKAVSMAFTRTQGRKKLTVEVYYEPASFTESSHTVSVLEAEEENQDALLPWEEEEEELNTAECLNNTGVQCMAYCTIENSYCSPGYPGMCTCNPGYCFSMGRCFGKSYMPKTASDKQRERDALQRAVEVKPQALQPDIDIPGIDHITVLKATSSLYLAAGGFMSKLPKYAEQVLQRLIDDPNSDPKENHDGLTVEDCAEADGDDSCELVKSTGFYAARKPREANENYAYFEDAETKTSDHEDVVDGHVMNIAKALRVSGYKNSPSFWVGMAQGLGNLFTRTIIDIQAIFNVYFAGDPLWDGNCKTMEAVIDLPFEHADGMDQGVLPSFVYSENEGHEKGQEKGSGDCGAKCMAYQKGSPYAEFGEEFRQQGEDQDEFQDKTYSPFLDMNVAYGHGYSRKDEAATNKARMAFFTPDPPTRTPLGGYFFESYQDTAVYGRFWCKTAEKVVQVTSPKHSHIKKVRATLQAFSAATQKDGPEGQEFEKVIFRLDEACQNPTDCTERTDCEKAEVTKPFVAMFPSLFIAARDMKMKVNAAIKEAKSAEESLKEVDDQDSAEGKKGFQAVRAATFKALQLTRTWLMMLGACNGHDRPLNQAWAAREKYHKTTGKRRPGFMWSPRHREAFCKAITKEELFKAYEAAPREEEQCHDTGVQCKTYCDPVSELMKDAMTKGLGGGKAPDFVRFVPGSQCVEGKCRCVPGSCYDRRTAKCVPSAEIRRLEHNAAEHLGGEIPDIREDLRQDFLAAFRVRAVLPLYLQRTAVAKKQMRLRGEFFNFFKEIVAESQKELARDRLQRMQDELKARVQDLAKRTQKISYGDTEGRLTFPLWTLTYRMAVVLATAPKAGFCGSGAALWMAWSALGTSKSWDKTPQNVTQCVQGKVAPSDWSITAGSCGTRKVDEDKESSKLTSSVYNPIHGVMRPMLFSSSYSSNDRDITVSLYVKLWSKGLGAGGTEGGMFNPNNPQEGLFSKLNMENGGFWNFVTKELPAGGTSTVMNAASIANVGMISGYVGAGFSSLPLVWFVLRTSKEGSFKQKFEEALTGSWTGMKDLIMFSFASFVRWSTGPGQDAPGSEGISSTDHALVCGDPKQPSGVMPEPPRKEVDGEEKTNVQQVETMESAEDHRDWEEQQRGVCNSMCGGKSFWTDKSMTKTIKFGALRLNAFECATCTHGTDGCSESCRVKEGNYCCQAIACKPRVIVPARAIEKCEEPRGFVGEYDFLDDTKAQPCCHTACGAFGFERDEEYGFLRFADAAFLTNRERKPTHCAECYWRKRCPESNEHMWVDQGEKDGARLCCRKHKCQKRGEIEAMIKKEQQADLLDWQPAPECRFDAGTHCGAKAWKGYDFQREKHTFLNEDGQQSCAVCQWKSRGHSCASGELVTPVAGGKSVKGVASKLYTAVFEHLCCLKFECIAKDKPDKRIAWVSLLEEEDEDLDKDAMKSPNVPLSSPWVVSASERQQLKKWYLERSSESMFNAAPAAARALLETNSSDGGSPLKGLNLNVAVVMDSKLSVALRYRDSPDPADEDDDGNVPEVLKRIWVWSMGIAVFVSFGVFDTAYPLQMTGGFNFGVDVTNLLRKTLNIHLREEHKKRIEVCLNCLMGNSGYCDSRHVLPQYTPKTHEVCIPDTPETGKKCTAPIKFDDNMEPNSPRFISRGAYKTLEKAKAACMAMRFVGANAKYKRSYGPSGVFRDYRGRPVTLDLQYNKEVVKRDDYGNTIEDEIEDPEEDKITAEDLSPKKKRSHG
eukprot:TRINITY_DN16058_c0_g2_i1.p1 TRINITY_DN16058_c0_g2~~TRINITY_DN16058_c0_g2_i1.p1  ORF type:complete len:2494 (+),score=549.32 TRINITY_DN16058_c0_g2_i1:115-7596(+)